MEKFVLESNIREFDDYEDFEESEIQDFLNTVRDKFPTVEIFDNGKYVTYIDTMDNLYEIALHEAFEFTGGAQSINEEEIKELVDEQVRPA